MRQYFEGTRDAHLCFTQPDTLVPDPAHPQSLNRYAYALGNPVKYTDPTGHIEDAWGDMGGGNPGAWAINPEGWHPLDPFRNPLEVSAAEDAQAQAAAESEVAVAAEAEAWQTVDQNIDIGGVVRSAEGGSQLELPFEEPIEEVRVERAAVNGNTTAVDTGNRFRYDQLNGGTGVYGPSQTQARYPNTPFHFAGRGESSPDVTVLGRPHPSEYPNSQWPEGVNYGDWKPRGPSGIRQFLDDIRTGKLPETTVMLPYDPETLTLLDRTYYFPRLLEENHYGP